mmetsp:Transcript_9999/g.9001  ORF Transcript_9999/g.9001 Transcript_9999/m.9001 type:complete len:319 (+) Transcript_9999:115-1071(+)|eukprot:CAMPEP_0201564144 /NCGR_PEP_ID=MMETSP0190_2-20130828/2168_1 /ASSEMBLY_ACC=CAM_ASM_000263 /TAXON_ID=37353 /ORGANISM="Rosalina sp." /LENGTH=318 /DNA_ID=CAMNT_0047979911 /DNA_START=93 /DNA_END=1049 /DNA_ORIENTATION=+
MGHGGAKKGRAAGPYVVGSATSGILEILIFHPVDTVAKRLMSNTEAIFQTGSKDNMKRLNNVLFKDAVNRSFFGKWLSLFPGVSFGAAYKVLQRTYKFGSQPLLRDWMARNYGTAFANTFGAGNSRDMTNACAGALVGIGEVFLLPLDVLKIKSQTNPEVLKGRGLVDLIVNENFKLYRGIGWTAARNCPGSFALFGANSLVYTRIFGVSGPKEAKGYQIFLGSMSGGIASIMVSSPLDVIKTRIQNKPFDDPRSGFKVFSDLMKEEGPHALFKGLTPKLSLIGPKLVFSFTVAQALIAKLQDVWIEKGWEEDPDKKQ